MPFIVQKTIFISVLFAIVSTLFSFGNALGACKVQNLPNQIGIIGEMNFCTKSAGDRFISIEQAVGNFGFERKTPNFFGVGTVLKDETQKKLYILTAKHNIYDPKTLRKRVGKPFWYNEHLNLYLDVDLSELPDFIDEWNFVDDFIMIQIPFIEDVGFPISNVGVDLFEPGLLEKTSQDLYSFGNIVRDQFIGPVYQSDLILQKRTHLKFPVVATNMDGVLGMSGSPIVRLSSDKGLTIIGIFIGVTAKENCSTFSMSCRNLVLILGTEDWGLKD